jgi:putative MFS transporter
MIPSSAARGGIAFERPGLFWAGVALSTLGVLLHLPMYWHARHDGFRMAGMPMDHAMMAGMVLLMAGMLATMAGVWPRAHAGSDAPPPRIRALDEAKLRPAHVALLLVMAFAVTIDVMKPTTLAFVVPGMAAEYGLRSPLNPTGAVTVAWLPFAGITGTVLGSFLWGAMGDRIGRRASILVAGVMFISTSVCGAMPEYWLHFLMCFLMGLGVGGMLPIAYALMAEVIPARHRGWMMVLIGGDIAGAYILTSWLSAELTPHFGWRILWLIGLPSGVLLILLNRWIPESPRYLLAKGRVEEARAVMDRYGAAIVPEDQARAVPSAAPGSWSELLRGSLLAQTAVVGLLGAGIGLVTFGFNLWMPSNLRALGFTEVNADRVLRDSALLGLPITLGAALLYGVWSSRWTVLVLAASSAAALIALAVLGNDVVRDPWLLRVLLAVPIGGITATTAVLSVYSAEVFPTRIRSRAAGFAAGISKAGGVLIIAAVIGGLAAPSITSTTLIGAVPMTLATVALLLFGIETRRRGLEDISGEGARARG